MLKNATLKQNILNQISVTFFFVVLLYGLGFRSDTYTNYFLGTRKFSWISSELFCHRVFCCVHRSHSIISGILGFTGLLRYEVYQDQPAFHRNSSFMGRELLTSVCAVRESFCDSLRNARQAGLLQVSRKYSQLLWWQD